MSCLNSFHVWCCSDLQNKKGNILQASVDYIKRLKREQIAVSELVARQEELEKTNRQLALDVQVSYLPPALLSCVNISVISSPDLA